jgi:hypothetical protein
MAVFIADPGGLVPTTSPESTPIEPEAALHEPGAANRPPEPIDTDWVRESSAQ